MRSEVFTIAKSVSDLIGPVGAETLLLKQIIKKYWKKSSDSFVEDIISVCFNFNTGEVRPEAADGIIAAYRVILGEDFISKVLPEIDMVIGSAYDKGRQYLMDRIMDGSISIKRVDSNIIENLMLISGSQKDSVVRTIQRWFETTQGAYFERFIIPETARLLSYAEDAEGNIENMRAIGEKYKAFVEADGYWSAVSEYNVETSKIFSQVQLLEEMNITTYRIEAVLDEVTCDVCQWLHGTEWRVEDAVARMNTMIIMEEENVREVNPFPSRQDPKEIEDPQESGYLLPPYHPRCRCGIVTTESSVFSPSKMPEAAAPIVPSDRGLNNIFNKYIHNATDDDLGAVLGRFPNLTPDLIRILTKAELGRVKKAYNAIPYSLRKWALGNNKNYTIMAVSQKTKISSRVIGNIIQINEKYLGTKYGPEVIMHELRHALINAQIIAKRGGARGAESIWDLLMVGKGKIKMPIHVNNMYKLNGGRGTLAAHAGVDEFLAMMGDYYKPGMSFDDFVKAVRDIEVEKIQGSLSTIYANATNWTAAEAKAAAQLWWDMVDVPNYTLMSKKQLLAKMGHKPCNAAIQRIAYENERRLQDIFKRGDLTAAQLGDHEPFDVWIGGDAHKFYAGSKPFKKYMPKQVIEVKSIIRAKNSKITMHKDSLGRKKFELKVFGENTTGHTVVFDDRYGKIYYKKGVGSFNLSAMREVGEDDLIRIFGGKVTQVEFAPKPSLTFTQITNKTDFKLFANAMNNVKKEHRDYLTWYSWEEYKKKGTKIYLASDGSTGYGIDPDGTLISLFSAEGSSNGKLAIEDALRRGVSRLECFDGKLPEIYGQYGFKTIERYPWDASQAPTNWNYAKRGEPDFVVMRRGPVGQVVEHEGTIPIFRKENIVSSRLLDKDSSGVNPSYIIEAEVGPEGTIETFLYKPVDDEVWRLTKGIEELENLTDSEIMYKYADIGNKLSNPYLQDFDINLLDPVRNSIGNAKNAASFAQRELLAAEVYKHLDYDGLGFGYTTVPETYAVKKGKKIIGVASKWDDEAEDFIDAVSPEWMQRGIRSEITREEVYETLVFDYLIGNTDRHMHNLLKNSSNGRSILIDHGLTFPSAQLAKQNNGLSEFRSFVAHYGGIHRLDEAVGFREKAYLLEKLESLNTVELGKAFKLSKYEIAAFEERRKDLMVLIKMDKMEEYFGTYVDNANYMQMGSFDAKLMRSIHNHAALLDEIEVHAPPSIEEWVPVKANWRNKKTVDDAIKSVEEKFGVEINFSFTDLTIDDPMSASEGLKLVNDLGKELGRLNDKMGLSNFWSRDFGAGKRSIDIGVDKIHFVNSIDLDDALFVSDTGDIYQMKSNYASGVWFDDLFGRKQIGLASVDRLENMSALRETKTKLMIGYKESHDKVVQTIGGAENITGTLDHEVGHSLHTYLHDFQDGDYGRWHDLFYSETQDWWKENVSIYSATNFKEAFAESFSAFVHPEYGKSIRGRNTKLPKKVEDFFKKLFYEE